MAKRHNKNKHGVKYCQFKGCGGKNIEAVWTTSGLLGLGKREYACDKHKAKIDRNEDDGYMTEADYQTWGRL